MDETSYPYVGYKRTCAYNSAKGIIGLASYTNVARNDPVAHINAVAQQPVSVAVAASSSIF